MKEEWLPVEGFSNYEISTFGRCRNEKTGRFLARSAIQYGMLVVSLYQSGRQHRRSIASLVAQAFLPIPEREDFNTIIHLDGNRENCHVSNLAWRPRHFAIRYHRECFLDPFPHWRTPFVLIDTGEVFHHPSECARKYGLLEGGVYLALVNQRPCFPVGYRFEFIKKDNI